MDRDNEPERLEEATESLNGLLRGELSAVETYRQARERVQDEAAAAQLLRIEEDHEQAVAQLRESVRTHGGQPSESSGPWGTWAQAVTGAAKMFGVEAVLKVLKEGEEHGMKEYEEILANEDTDAACKRVVRETLIPQQQEHIAAIDQCMRTLH
jgi:uncharacterized protein (TIGR02284 family)